MMPNCCSTSKGHRQTGKRRCPGNGREYFEVSLKTVIHHLRHPWRWTASGRYYFCDDPDCDVVYFGDDDSVIRSAELRTVVGLKTRSDDALLCYCFGISNEVALSDPAARAYVVEQTAAGLCACETRNPAGRCCLKDFPKAPQRLGSCSE